MKKVNANSLKANLKQVQMGLIMGQIEPEYLELFALEFGKIAEYDFVYTLSSTNINQSAPNLVTIMCS